MIGSRRNSRTVLVTSLCVGLLAAAASVSAQDKTAPKKVTYEDHVKPIFRAKCFSCHSTDKKTADLDLSNYTSMMQGGASGTAIEPGSAEDSYLWMVVNHETEPYMPPKSDKMPAEMLNTIKSWIDLGALENSGSKAMIKKKKPDLTLSSAPSGKPEGPAAMPRGVLIDPVLHTGRPAAVKALATSPWAPLVAMAAPKQVVLYDTKSRKVAGVLPFEEGDPYVLRFSRNGELLMVAGGRGAANGLAAVFSVRTGERLFDVGDELDAVLTADISADQSMIAIGGTNRIVRVYATATGEMLYEIKKHTDWVTALEFSPDGVLLATGDRNGGMHVWEAYTGRLYSSLAGHKGATTGLSWRSDSNILSSCSEDGTIKLWEMENGKAVKSWNAHGGGALGLEFARDGRIVSSGRDKVCKLWAQDGKQIVAFPGFSDIATRATFDDETNTVIAGDLTGAVRAWLATDAKQMTELSSNPQPLDELVAATKAQSGPLKQAMEKAAADYKAMQDSLAKTQAALKGATQKKTAAEAAIKKLNTDIAALAKVVQAKTAQHSTENAQLGSLKKAAPLLQESLKQALAASAQLKADKELAATAAQLKKYVDARQATLKTLEASVPKIAAELKAAAEKKAASEQAVKSNTQIIATATKVIADSTKTVASQTAAAQKLKASTDTASAAFAGNQAEVGRLELYVKLRTELKALATVNEELATKEGSVQEIAANSKSAEANSEAMKAMLDKAAGDVSTAAKTRDNFKAAVDQSVAQIGRMTEQKTALEKAAPVLAAALKQSQEAAKAAPADKEIAAVVASIDGLLKKKQKEVTDLTSSIAAANQKKTADAKAMAEAVKAVQVMEQRMAEAREKHLAAVSAMQTAQKSLQAAEQEFAAVQKRVDGVRTRVEQIRNQLSPVAANGNEQASAN